MTASESPWEDKFPPDLPGPQPEALAAPLCRPEPRKALVHRLGYRSWGDAASTSLVATVLFLCIAFPPAVIVAGLITLIRRVLS